jgi:hypothetical protein
MKSANPSISPVRPTFLALTSVPETRSPIDFPPRAGIASELHFLTVRSGLAPHLARRAQVVNSLLTIARELVPVTSGPPPSATPPVLQGDAAGVTPSHFEPNISSLLLVALTLQFVSGGHAVISVVELRDAQHLHDDSDGLT